MKNKTIDCRSDEGLTIGLIDSVIYIMRVLEKRDLNTPNIQEALKDLKADQQLKNLLYIEKKDLPEYPIKTGDKILIKDNLMSELVRLGFNEQEMESFVQDHKGTTQKALQVYEDDDSKEVFVTVGLCCEIPIKACTLL